MSIKEMATAMGKVGVLMGGRSAEREISLRSGSGVLGALQAKGVNAHAFDTGERSLADLAAEAFDRVFITLHGRYGEDGSIQGALEQLGIPYTGSGVMACAIAMDKIMTKRIWMSHDLPTPKFMVVTANTTWEEVTAVLGVPFVVKPAHEGSSIGLSRVHHAAEFAKALELASRYDHAILAETLIDGMELTCAVIEEEGVARALPIVRIQAPEGNYDYQNKYFSGKTRYFCPSGLPEALEKRIQEDVLKSYQALQCRGWGRADLMLRSSDQQHFLLEMNCSPGMTETSLVPMAAREVGMDYGTLCLTLLKSAALG